MKIGTWFWFPLVLVIPQVGFAADFYLHFYKCIMTVSYLVLADESLKTIDTDGSLTSCTRHSQTVHCEFDFLGKGAPNRSSDKYKIEIETPPLLVFTNERRTDYYVIDQTEHAATLITRIISPKFAGAKICHGTYMTESERKKSQKSRQK